MTLEDRMLSYESREARRTFIPRLPIMVRLDGRSFHKVTRHCECPFDAGFHSLMVAVAKTLAGETTAPVAYVQSDEITLALWYDNRDAEPYFGGRVQKIVSSLAGMASAEFNAVGGGYVGSLPSIPATFDCRAWQVPSLEEAANVLIWREQDASRNSVQMAARAVFSHKECHGKNASELQDMLSSELVSTRAFQVLERKEINAVLSEQDLSASGRVSQSTLVKMRKIKGAKFLIAGTVAAFEKTSAKGGKVRFKGLSVGGKKEKTYIAVDVKIIDAETGEIVDARTIEATIKAKAIGAGLSVRNFSIAGADAKKTPTGKAIRACIVYISEYLACSLVQGLDAPCMKKWDKMDARRREKTKGVLSLD